MNLPRPTPSMAVASTALLVALGGTGYAASKLPANSVDKRAIKRGAVGSSEIRDGSILARDLHGYRSTPTPTAGTASGTRATTPGTVTDGLRGDRGPAGPQGPQGPAGHDAT